MSFFVFFYFQLISNFMQNDMSQRLSKTVGLKEKIGCRDHCPALFSYSVRQKGYFTRPLTVGISSPLISLLSCLFTLFHLINRLDICVPFNRLSIAMSLFHISPDSYYPTLLFSLLTSVKVQNWKCI